MRNTNKLTISYFNTSLGFWFATFFIPLITLDVSKSPLLVTISFALNIIPYILITPFAGVLSDTMNREKIIVFGELCCCILGMGLCITQYQGNNVIALIVINLFISLLSAIHHPVFQSIIPDIVSSDKIKTINSHISMVDNFTSVIAPISIGVMMTKVDKDFLLILHPYFTYFIFCYKPYTKPETTLEINIKSVFCL